MKCTLSNFIMFAVGAGIGSLATWLLVKRKYEQRANDEVGEMREYYNDKLSELYEKNAKPETDISEEEETDEPQDEIVSGKYELTLKENGYIAYDDISSNSNKEVDAHMKGKPYVISPDEYGENDDYEILSFTYYSDGVLTDDADEVMSREEIEETVGRESLSHFGDYDADPDSVFVRNDERQCDYEILFDSSTYEESHHQEVGE